MLTAGIRAWAHRRVLHDMYVDIKTEWRCGGKGGCLYYAFVKGNVGMPGTYVHRGGVGAPKSTQ